jgi:hypothetical protein
MSVPRREYVQSFNEYLRNRSSEHYNLIELANTLHELVHTRPLYDINIMERTLNLDRYGKVGLMENLNSLAWIYYYGQSRTLKLL